MSYPINYPTPQGANVQMFFANATSAATQKETWTKPQGASFVFFSLVGAGGSGGNATSDGTAGAAGGGGGSGSVLNCLVPAFAIPDQLQVAVGGRRQGANGASTEVIYQQKDGTGYTLLSAGGGVVGDTATVVTPGVSVDAVGGAGGTVGASAFRALGFSNGTTGQTGSTGNTAQTLPTDIFVIGGNGGSGAIVTGHYGYPTALGGQGYDVISPIINGRTSRSINGASTVSNALAQYAGFGCGGNGAFTSSATTTYGLPGGPGLAVIISW